MWARVDNRKPLLAVLVGLASVAWLSLWVWGASPYGRFLSHEHLGEIDLASNPLQMGVFVTGWTLMIVAMMLPTSLPLVMLFHSIAAKRPDRVWLVLLVIGGYLGIWSLFGFAVHLGDWQLHGFVEGLPWLEHNHWLIASATLVLAGVYQFTPLKYQCLDKCRSPLSFIMEHWRGSHEREQAFMLGVHHGLFCIGCCWALMLLMFAVGVGNLGWMLVLAAIMAIEKNVSWGRRLSAPLGVFLIGVGIMLGLGSALGVLGEHMHS